MEILISLFIANYSFSKPVICYHLRDGSQEVETIIKINATDGMKFGLHFKSIKTLRCPLYHEYLKFAQKPTCMYSFTGAYPACV